MFTPFLAHLMQHVGVFEKYARDSEAADQGATGGMRCPDLSAKQIKGAKEIYEAVTKIHLNPTSSTDEQTYKIIRDLLSKHRQAALTAISTFNAGLIWYQQVFKKNDTFFLKLLAVFTVHFERSYQYFHKYRLLNVVHESTPLIMLNTHGIDYLVYRAAHLKKLEIGYYSYFMGAVKNWTYDHELAAQKEALVLSYLDNPKLIDSRDTVRSYAHAIRNADGQVLEQKAIKGTLEPSYYGASAKIPVAYRYSPYKLHEEMTAVLSKLDGPKFNPLPEMTLTHFLREDHHQSPQIKSKSNSPDDDENDDFHECTTALYLPSKGVSELTSANLQRLNESQSQGSSSGESERKGTFSVTYSDGGDSQECKL